MERLARYEDNELPRSEGERRKVRFIKLTNMTAARQ
jgi:hypothetical protein